jgi:processive 1,2-diacylglycerol beta-glucosyltransferase
MPSSSSYKILILSSNTGGGHRSAAAALSAAAQQSFQPAFPPGSIEIRISNAVEESHPLPARLVRLYNWLLRNKQHWMKYFYWSVNRFRPDAADFFYRRSAKYLRELLNTWPPDVIVSVHPLVQHIPARILREQNMAARIPLVCVVTDPGYGFWRGWACDGVARYFVANAEAQRQLTDYGVPTDRITVSGMPVHPKFVAPAKDSVRAARVTLGLDPEKFTVLVNAGYEGGGNILDIFKELLRADSASDTAANLPIQAIFIAGRNAALQAQVQSVAAAARFPVVVIGYCERMEQVMAASSVMISKLGGMTTFEAFACGLPVIADVTTAPMPQEAATAELLRVHGAGVLLDRAANVRAEIRRMIQDPAYHASLCAAAAALAIPGAACRILEQVAAMLAQRPEEAAPATSTVAFSPSLR